jgi:molybdopterin converting factor subunit 1
MRIHVRLFALLRDRAGAGEVALDLPAGATAADVTRGVAERFPALDALLRRTAVAVNHEYAAPDTAIGPEDEVALIPPVSGG